MTPVVIGQVRDGSGRDHDVYLEIDGGEVSLQCPSAYWSATFTPDEGDLLWPAIKEACDRARRQARK